MKDLLITVERRWKKQKYTIGKLSINGKPYCETLEDPDRGLTSAMPLAEIQKRKIKGDTAIPTGKYRVVETFSPKFRKTMPLLLNVPGYEGVRIHPGNDASSTEGCLLVGQNKAVGKVLNSRATFDPLHQQIKETIAQGGNVFITIQ